MFLSRFPKKNEVVNVENRTKMKPVKSPNKSDQAAEHGNKMWIPKANRSVVVPAVIVTECPREYCFNSAQFLHLVDGITELPTSQSCHEY